jgi:hypothetical protein
VTVNNAGSAFASFTAPSTASTLSFQLTVTDNQGATSSAGVSVIVTAPNLPPVANAGSNQSVASGVAVTLDGSASVDPDGSIVAYQWVQTAGPTVSLNNAGNVIASFKAPATTSTLSFQLTVTDNSGARSSANVTVNVTAPNLPPVANAGPDQTARRYFKVTLNGSASSDPDGSIAHYQWTQLSGPSVKLNGYATATPYFNASAKPGTVYSFLLTVTDDRGATSSDSVNVTVKPLFGPADEQALESWYDSARQRFSDYLGN